MAAKPRLSEAARIELLRSLTEVGARKSVGYLPLYTIRDFVRRDAADVAADAVARGLVATLFGPKECCIKSGALYVYDREALARLLQARSEVLVREKLPLDPEPFLAHIAAVWFEPDHPAHPVIAAAFGDELQIRSS
jgi:hypothetical protein